mgnify:CR=1 FL=1
MQVLEEIISEMQELIEQERVFRRNLPYCSVKLLAENTLSEYAFKLLREGKGRREGMA